MPEGALRLYAGLDLADEKGMFCGKVLAELGATVIKAETPAGDPSRCIGPFYHNVPEPQKSQFWFFFNTNKKGITLNLESEDGRELFRQLSRKMDFVIESFKPGYLDSLGLGYGELDKLNPRLVMISVTPFGQTGPHSHFKSDDIVAMAMGGYMQFTGDPDRAPLRFSVPQSYVQAGAHAALTGAAALYHARLTGQGQQVDVSMVEAVARALHQELVYWEVDRFITTRQGDHILRSGLRIREAWDCKDGQVGYRIILGPYVRSLREVVELMRAEGLPTGSLGEVKDWDALEYTKVDQQTIVEWERLVGNYFMRHTKQELFERSIERGFYLAPSFNVKEILEFEHLNARGFWTDIEHDELGDSFPYPGEPVKLNLTPYRTTHRAPLIGEHNREVYGGLLGLSREEIVVLKQAGVI